MAELSGRFGGGSCGELSAVAEANPGSVGAGVVSPTVGKDFEIMPRAAQASRLKNILSESRVT